MKVKDVKEALDKMDPDTEVAVVDQDGDELGELVDVQKVSKLGVELVVVVER